MYKFSPFSIVNIQGISEFLDKDVWDSWDIMIVWPIIAIPQSFYHLFGQIFYFCKPVMMSVIYTPKVLFSKLTSICFRWPSKQTIRNLLISVL